MTDWLLAIFRFFSSWIYGSPQKWISIADRSKCALPTFDGAYIYLSGQKSFYLTDLTLITELTHLSGPSMFFGYDKDRPAGDALPADQWIQVRLRMGRPTVAVIRFERNDTGVYLWYHPDMNVDGEPPGWHPCALIKVPRDKIENWLLRAREKAL